MLFFLSFYILDRFFRLTYWDFRAYFLRAELIVICILAILTPIWPFPSVNMCVLLKNKFLGKGLFTVFTTETLFPCVKHHVFIKSRFGSVGLSTLNTHTDMLLFSIWLIAHAMYQFNVLCHRWFLSRPVITKLALKSLSFMYSQNMPL